MFQPILRQPQGSRGDAGCGVPARGFCAGGRRARVHVQRDRPVVGTHDVQVRRSNRCIAFEDAQFGYDRLGHLIRLVRSHDPLSTSTVATTWHFDSLGQVLELHEPDSAPQFRSYTHWGERTIDAVERPHHLAGDDRRLLSRYDALGRVVHREEQTNQVVDAATVNDFVYDQAVHTPTPPVTATHVLGRLAKATSPTSSVSFSYDAFGQINAQVFTDRTTTSANVYVEKQTFHGDGSLQALDLLLPDTSFNQKRARGYIYDSAGRTRTVKYADGTSNMDLLTATGGTDIDMFGRVRQAKYGLATYTATTRIPAVVCLTMRK